MRGSKKLEAPSRFGSPYQTHNKDHDVFGSILGLSVEYSYVSSS